MASRSPSIHDGMVVRVLLFPLKLGFALGLGLAGLLLVAWTVDWVCVDYVWPGRVEGLRQLLAAEIAAGMELAARQGAPATSVLERVDWLYSLVFELTGLHEMGQRFAGSRGLSIADTVVRDAWIARHDMIETAMLSTQLLGLRAGIFVQILPLVTLLYAVGAADGMHQWANRRARVAPESARLYHRAKIGQVLVLVLGGAGALVWPRPIAWPNGAALAGVVVTLLAAAQLHYNKKHA